MSNGLWLAVALGVVICVASCDDPGGTVVATGGTAGSAGAGGSGDGGDGGGCEAETCDGFDNDCDGVVDEDCPCDDGSEQECYTGNPVTVNIGECRYGTQTCTSGAWAPCEGEVLPAAETCDDDLDNDCDSQVDEDCPPPARCSDQFDDVPPTDSAYDYIRALYVHEIINGCSTTPLLYCPDDPLLRRQMAVVLIKAMGETPSTAGINEYFTDLTNPQAAPYINRLLELGITQGCGTNLYCPDDPTLRSQAAVFIIRALNESQSSAAQDAYFTDLGGTTAWSYVNRLFELGITQGCGTNLYCPDDPLLRDHGAVFIAKAFQYTTEICDP